MSVRFQELEAEWDEDNIEHPARHGVHPEEVEEIVYEDCHPSWIMRGRRRGIKEPDGPCSDKLVQAGT